MHVHARDPDQVSGEEPAACASTAIRVSSRSHISNVDRASATQRESRGTSLAMS
jgi:hypothetical protein